MILHNITNDIFFSFSQARKQPHEKEALLPQSSNSPKRTLVVLESSSSPVQLQTVPPNTRPPSLTVHQQGSLNESPRPLSAHISSSGRDGSTLSSTKVISSTIPRSGLGVPIRSGDTPLESGGVSTVVIGTRNSSPERESVV